MEKLLIRDIDWNTLEGHPGDLTADQTDRDLVLPIDMWAVVEDVSEVCTRSH